MRHCNKSAAIVLNMMTTFLAGVTATLLVLTKKP